MISISISHLWPTYSLFSRYVSAGSNERRFVFKVPFNGCGSKPSCSICASVDNILIIQNDQDIQESWDTARKITCSRSDEQEKTVYFRPFVVDMLEVISVETPSGPVECWMEIGTGLPPNIKPINYTLKLGTDITFTINVKQSKQTWDINILQCYASDDPSFDTATTNKLQLSDKNGCSLKTKVFGQWKKLESIPGQTLTYYNTLKAFKFPDRSQVYLKCDIELCNGACERNFACGEELIDPIKPHCSLGSTDPACQAGTTRPPKKPRCYPGSTDPRCPDEPKTTASSNCYPGSLDPRCPQEAKTTSKPQCTPGSTDPDCQPATYLPPTSGRPRVTTTAKPNCYPGSTDISCPHSLVTSTSPPDTTPVYCYPGSVDPRCPDTYKGSTPIPATYLPPLSNPGYDRTVRDAKSKFFNEINKLAITNNNVFELDDDEDAEPARIKRDLSDLNINPLTSTDQSDDLLSRKIMKREFNERQPEREVISFTLGIRTAINVN